jgi:hypothetical protein
MYKRWQLPMPCSFLLVFLIFMSCVSQGNLVQITSHPTKSQMQLAWCVPQLHHRMLGGIVSFHSLAGRGHLCGQPDVAAGKKPITECFKSIRNKPDVFPWGTALRAKRDGVDHQSNEFDGSSQSFRGRHDSPDDTGHSGPERQHHHDRRFPGKNHDQDEKTSHEQADLYIRPNPPPQHLLGLDKLSGAETARTRSSLYGRPTSPGGGGAYKGTQYVSADDASPATQRKHRIGSRGEQGRSRGMSSGRDASTSSRTSENSATLARDGYGGEGTRGRTGGSGYVRAADRQTSGHRSGGTGLFNAAGRKKPRKLSERGESLYAVAVRHEKKGNHAAARRIFEMLAVNA